MKLLGQACLVLLSVTVFLLVRDNRRIRQANALITIANAHPRVGARVPRFEARTLAGDSLVPFQPSSGVRLLFVFNTSCEFCKASMPALAEIQSRINAESSPIPSRLLAIGLDSIPALTRYAVEHSMSTPVVPMDQVDAQMSRLSVVPVLLAVDSSGMVQYARVGGLTHGFVVDSLAQVLAAGQHR